MSSVHAFKSQVAPFKHYIATANGVIYEANGTSTIATTANMVFQDMGKTIFLDNGHILRKVKEFQATPVGNALVGYIYITQDGISGAQNIAALN